MLFAVRLQQVGHSETIRAAIDARERELLIEQVVAERERLVEVNGELEAANRSLAEQASHDALTGLANRLLFIEHLSTALARGRRDGTTTAVLFFDLDRFKVVNDSLGHAAGDALLRSVATRVGTELRDGDVLSRLGGDEFTVLLTGLQDAAEAVEIADRISASFTRPFVLEGRQVRVSASIGVGLDHDHRDTPDDLLRHADAALYRAKGRGGTAWRSSMPGSGASSTAVSTTRSRSVPGSSGVSSEPDSSRSSSLASVASWPSRRWPAGSDRAPGNNRRRRSSPSSRTWGWCMRSTRSSVPRPSRCGPH